VGKKHVPLEEIVNTPVRSPRTDRARGTDDPYRRHESLETAFLALCRRHKLKLNTLPGSLRMALRVALAVYRGHIQAPEPFQVTTLEQISQLTYALASFHQAQMRRQVQGDVQESERRMYFYALVGLLAANASIMGAMPLHPCFSEEGFRDEARQLAQAYQKSRAS
jgi:hypothetical protein